MVTTATAGKNLDSGLPQSHFSTGWPLRRAKTLVPLWNICFTGKNRPDRDTQ